MCEIFFSRFFFFLFFFEPSPNGKNYEIAIEDFFFDLNKSLKFFLSIVQGRPLTCISVLITSLFLRRAGVGDCIIPSTSWTESRGSWTRDSLFNIFCTYCGICFLLRGASDPSIKDSVEIRALKCVLRPSLRLSPSLNWTLILLDRALLYADEGQIINRRIRTDMRLQGDISETGASRAPDIGPPVSGAKKTNKRNWFWRAMITSHL